MPGETTRQSNKTTSNYDPLVIGVIDQDADVELMARRHGENRLSEEINQGVGIKSMVNKIWKGGIARNYYRQKNISQARQDIIESGSLLFDEDRAEQQKFLFGTINEFTSKTEGVINENAGDRRERLSASHPEILAQANELIRSFVEDKISADSVEEEFKRIINDAPDIMGEKLSANNVTEVANEAKRRYRELKDNFEIAKAAKGSFDHEKALKRVMGGFDVFYGSKQFDTLEPRLNKVDEITEKIQSSKFGQIISPETVSVGVAIASCVVGSGAKTIVGTALRGIAPGVGGAVWAGMRESAVFERERSQVAYDLKYDREFDRDNDKKRAELLETMYDIQSAPSITNDLQAALNKLELSLADDSIDIAPPKNETDPNRKKLYSIAKGIAEQMKKRDYPKGLDGLLQDSNALQAEINNRIQNAKGDKNDSLSDDDKSKVLGVVYKILTGAKEPFIREDTSIEAKKTLTDEGREGLFSLVLSAQTRLDKTNEDGVALIGFSSVANAPNERLKLIETLALSKQFLRNNGMDDIDTRLARTSDEVAEALANIDDNMNKKDKLARKLKLKRSAKAAGIGMASGLVIGTVLQEATALMNHNLDGISEVSQKDRVGHSTLLASIFDESDSSTPIDQVTDNDHFIDDGSGAFSLIDNDGKIAVNNISFNADGSLTDESIHNIESHGITVSSDAQTETISSEHMPVIQQTTEEVSVEQLIQNDPGATHHVTRDYWYNNNTPGLFENNELGAHYYQDPNTGGRGIVTSMTDTGSTYGDTVAEFSRLAENNEIKLYISATENTQTETFVITGKLLENGQLAFVPEPGSPAERFFDENGQFIGRYGEVAQSLGVDENGVEHIAPLATVVGDGYSGTVPDAVETISYESAAETQNAQYQYTFEFPEQITEISISAPAIVPSGAMGASTSRTTTNHTSDSDTFSNPAERQRESQPTGANASTKGTSPENSTRSGGVSNGQIETPKNLNKNEVKKFARAVIEPGLSDILNGPNSSQKRRLWFNLVGASFLKKSSLVNIDELENGKKQVKLTDQGRHALKQFLEQNQDSSNIIEKFIKFTGSVKRR